MKNTLIFLLALAFCLSETTQSSTPENKPDDTFKHIICELQELNKKTQLKNKISFNITMTCNTSTKETLEQLNTELHNITDEDNQILQRLKKNVMEMLKYFKQGKIIDCVSTSCKKPSLGGFIRKLQNINRNCSFTLPKS
ncbi:hypothetical protein KOW79_012465 [Hemibagrus wyckioides]|uniref:Uncharacterized protein n=1 Tax=Hemibagrus wyckioides TaxID=337641 RepID=A0A9D3NM75_9TELE|nr:hypothetical protein KOW79_012465 [Hemibagrus wyckioides]